MIFARCLYAVVFVIGSGAFGMAGAQTEASSAVQALAESLPRHITKRILSSKERFIQQVSNDLFRISPDGVATVELIELMAARDRATARARKLAAVFIYDLDGDGIVSSEEIQRVLPHISARERSSISVIALEADGDKNGSLTLAEFVDYFNRQLDAHDGSRRSSIDVMKFDVDKNKRVDLAEVKLVADLVAEKRIEGVANTPKKRNRSREEQRHRTRSVCNLPKPPKGVETVLLSGHYADAISTVAVAGQDVATHVASVAIQSGKAPLMVIAGAGTNMIWNVEGATNRVWKFVAQPSRHTKSGVGVAGLEKEKVHFVAPGSCFDPFNDHSEGKARIAETNLFGRLGREIDHVIGAYNLNGIALPDGSRAEAQRLAAYKEGQEFTLAGQRFRLGVSGLAKIGADGDFAPPTREQRGAVRSLIRFVPGGIVGIDASAVVASGAVEEYLVLPHQAGVLQLVAMGALRPANNGSYVIEKPIARFPAELHGAHHVNFILGKGVPMPKGTPGHSAVLSEETGECLSGSKC